MSEVDFCQIKLKPLENRLKSLLDNVVSDGNNLPKVDKDNNTVYNSCDNIIFKSRGRKASPDGFYFITVIFSSGSSSHSVLIRKMNNEFFLFDPNGKRWANSDCRDYFKFTIFYDREEVPLLNDITPDEGWNSSGYCSIWGIIIPILYGGRFPGDNNVNILSEQQIYKFYQQMNKYDRGLNVGDRWITLIMNKYIINNSRRYTTNTDVLWFIKEIRKEILVAVNKR